MSQNTVQPPVPPPKPEKYTVKEYVYTRPNGSIKRYKVKYKVTGQRTGRKKASTNDLSKYNNCLRFYKLIPSELRTKEDDVIKKARAFFKEKIRVYMREHIIKYLKTLKKT